MGNRPIQSRSLPVGLQSVTFTTTITKAVTGAGLEYFMYPPHWTGLLGVT